ncbi:MAG: AMP-dependent synthetase [Deltaproteobacteria bacterium]|nr:MAG: AMP-dependent synthetase [Deltaproteobacteria bacterium]
MDRHGIGTLEELQRRSTEEIEWFWGAVLEELEIEFYEPYERILDASRGIAWTQWCCGGKMNVVHNCLDKWRGTPVGRQEAVRWEGEPGDSRVLTYEELDRSVCRLANALRALGMKKGDSVALFMPMMPETVAALFAVAKLGGMVLPLFSGYGAAAVAGRLRDSGARFLLTVDGFYRRGQSVLLKPVADEAADASPAVEHMLVLKRLGTPIPWSPGRDRWWHEEVDRQTDDAETERTDAEDPLMIIYTSGTTGRPKGALHTHCGFPIKAAQDMVHGFDVRREDVLYWVTDMGWMMGPWEVFGTTLLGATMVLYEGALDFPGPDRLWSLVERHRVSILGVSPTLIRSLMRHGTAPAEQHDLSSLRILGSTGEPWNPDPWLWFFHTAGKGRLPIIRGTETSGGLVMGNLLTPLKPCAFAGPVPGIAADVVNEKGKSVRGQVGELVVRKPWIGMTRGFWNDSERYSQTYWSRFPDVWVHGDWAAVDEDGLWYILGRSDDTIKIAGKRLGPAEVESVLVGHPAVSEAAAIGVPDPIKGEALVCFCVLKPASAASEKLREELRARVAEQLGKPLKPEVLKFLDDLPKTRNAKIMRRIIRAAYLNQEPGDLSALENPHSVDAVRKAL